MTLKQTRMPQEGSPQVLSMADACSYLVHLSADLFQIIRAEVGHIRIRDIRPEILHRIKLRSVRWQKLSHKPRLLPSQIALHLATAVDGQPIPQKHQTLALEIQT